MARTLEYISYDFYAAGGQHDALSDIPERGKTLSVGFSPFKPLFRLLCPPLLLVLSLHKRFTTQVSDGALHAVSAYNTGAVRKCAG